MAATRDPAKPALPTEFGAAPPDVSDDESYYRVEFADVDADAESVEFEQCRFGRGTVTGELQRPTFLDCAVEGASWANLRLERASLVRVAFTGSRLTGLAMAKGSLRDVEFADCKLDLSAWRFAGFKAVRFAGCSLAGADFTEADLRGAEFVDCDLTGAQFSHATMPGARFAGCTLDDVGGIETWRGVTLRPTDVVALAYQLATAVGITLETDS